MGSKVTYTKTHGGYKVVVGGQEIGSVQHWERRYNLSRVTVVRGWRATTASGKKLFHADGTTADTRRAAAQALLLERQK